MNSGKPTSFCEMHLKRPQKRKMCSSRSATTSRSRWIILRRSCLALPVKKVFLEPSEEERICSKCGKQMDLIGTEFICHELKIIPAKAIVIEYYSVNYGCKNCKEHGITPMIIKGKDGKAYIRHGFCLHSGMGCLSEVL